MRSLAAILPIFLAIAAPVRAEEVAEASPASATASLSPDVVRLGGSFTLTVEIRDTADVHYELPPGLSLGKELDIVKASASRTLAGDEATTRFVLEVALFDLGEKTLDDLVLSATGPRGPLKLTLPGPKVTGVGDLKDDQEAELQDILPPVEVLVPRYTLLWIIGGTILATLALLLVWRWLKGRPKQVKIAPPPPRAPAHERALAALQQLQREDLPTQGRVKELHFRLSEILRDYLGERFGFLALDMTTEELLATLARTSTPGLDYARFEAWCREGDLVRYAKLPATPAACKAAIEEAFGFVRATMPQLRAKAGGAA